MKKTRSNETMAQRKDEMPTEIRFDYRKAKPNRFADKLKGGIRVVVLDPDVAAVFETPEAVNSVLRALIKAMAQKKPNDLILNSYSE